MIALLRCVYLRLVNGLCVHHGHRSNRASSCQILRSDTVQYNQPAGGNTWIQDLVVQSIGRSIRRIHVCTNGGVNVVYALAHCFT